MFMALCVHIFERKKKRTRKPTEFSTCIQLLLGMFSAFN